MKRLRLVKVVVHPIFVVDDGESLSEFPNAATEIPAAEWPDFPARLERDIAEAEAQLNAEHDGA
jgi:hypothetical protein